MNALELADKLKIAQGNNNVDELIPEVIETLHQQDYEIQDLAEWKRSLMEANSQQQAEIEALKAENKQLHDIVDTTYRGLGE
jgi:FtsZ-binding cell division protein ZapB